MLNLAAIAPTMGLIVKLDELLPVLATTVIFIATGLIVFFNPYPAPVVFGVQSGMMIPFGTYKNAIRTGAFPIRAGAAKAGDIESKNGRATAVPKPRNNVRRERCFPVIIIARGFSSSGMVRY